MELQGVALGFLALVAATACGGSGRDSHDPIEEIEPNDSDATATGLGGSGLVDFGGTCTAGESSDRFGASAVIGTIQVTLSFSDDRGEADLGVHSVGNAAVDVFEDTPPGAQQVQITTEVTIDGDLVIEVLCGNTAGDVSYAGTGVIP